MSLWCAWYHKHVTLVKNVYPQSPGEEGPRSSALSLLVFYATSKPQKLIKVGRYLENRVNQDLRNYKYGHVRVSLDIIKTLLHECKQKTAIISKNILRSLLAIYQCPERDLFLITTDTFVTFIGIRSREEVIDAELTQLLVKLLTVFCKASNQSNDHRQQISGLRALETLSSKNYFVQGTISIEKLEVVLEAVIQNFQPQLSPATTEPRMGDASIVDQLITVEDLMLISQQCLQGIFRNTNASTLKQLFELSLKIIDKKNGFEDCALFISILKGILSASPAQYHFTVVKSLWDRLDIETREVSSTTLVSGLRSLMSIRSLAGMTVPELLDNSFKQLEKIIEAGCTAENTTRVALVEAIGSLAIHTAYPNQVNEIFGYLLNKAELWYSAKESANPLMMISILESMESVLNRRSDPEERRSSVQPSLLPYELVQPLIKFFQVSNITIKSRLLDVLRIFLKMGMEYKHTPARTEFLDSIRAAMYILIQSKSAGLGDYVIAYVLLCNIVTLQSYTELSHSLPMLFQLQTKASKSDTMYTCQKISIHWLIVDYLIYVGDFLSLPTLLEYVKNLRAEFKSFPWQPPFAMDKFRFEKISEETFTDEIKSLPRLESVPKVDVDHVMSAIKVATFEDSAELITKIEHSLTQPFSTDITTSRDDMSVPTQAPLSEESRLEDSYRDIKKMMKVDSTSLKPPLQPKDINLTAEQDVSAEFNAPPMKSTTSGPPEVTEILKAITESLRNTANPSANQKKDSNDDYELDWLKSRSRQVSNQTGVVLSQKKPIVAEVRNIPGRRREPQIFELDGEDE